MTDTYRELLMGCGHRREKLMAPTGSTLVWHQLVTVDINPDVKPDYETDLNHVPWHFYSHRYIEGFSLTPAGYFPDGSFDEVHAYEVLEHLGSQGNARTFFECFSEIWRVLKPGGYLFATVPSRYSAWLWGDPSHRRAILPESLVFLDQTQYIAQLDGPRKTPMSDFRNIYQADFKVIAGTDNHETFMFCLQAVKPSRAAEPSRAARF